MPDTTIAAASAHLNMLEDERDALIRERDRLTEDVQELRAENADLRAQLANADRETAEAVAFAIRTGQALRASDPHGALIARYRFAATELEEFSDLDELPAHSSWCPDMLRAAADSLEANP